MSNRPEHRPTGHLCACGKLASQHKVRVEHAPMGDPCTMCGLAAGKHRNRSRATERNIVFLDGEGMGRAPHRYTLLLARSENGEVSYVENPAGLGSKDCLAFLASLPEGKLILGYSLGYDHTMWLRDLPDRLIFRLLHEETRKRIVKGKTVYRPIEWEGFQLNYMNGRMSVMRIGDKSPRVIWDIWRFFQSAFTKALVTWGIASKERLAHMQDMKDQRQHFHNVMASEIRGYCEEECGMGCQLARALIDSHDKAGIKLKDYYGAGSSASAILREIGIKEQIPKEYPPGLVETAAKAFFGGRFECARRGVIPGPVYSYDISSAYPYQMVQLPCLLHGEWKYYEGFYPRNIPKPDIALIKWHTPNLPYNSSWGPWPVRTSEGKIIFPLCGQGGWVYHDEWLAGKVIARNAIIAGSWVYFTQCNCKPFERIAHYYLERLKLGKDAKGLALKLAVNGGYGKTAQTKGDSPPFACPIWAGKITSDTRAQLLRLMTQNLSSIIMVATDGILSTAPLTPELPPDLGTGSEKPLGGWECKVYEAGVTIIRSGVYWPNDGVKDVSTIRARGIPRKTVLEHADRITAALLAGEPSYTIPGLQQFGGARECVTSHDTGYNRSKRYGEWTEGNQVLSFDPQPKRERVEQGRLIPWVNHGEESLPYDRMMPQEEEANVDV